MALFRNPAPGPAAGAVGDAIFEALLESAPDSVLGVSSDGRIVFANQEVERAFGYRREELIGRPVEVLVPESHWIAHARHRKRYFAEPRKRPMAPGLDLVARRKDGSEFSVEISLSPVQTADGLLVTAIVRDVTARRNAERRLRDHEWQLAFAQRVGRVGSWQYEPGSKRVSWSDELYRIYGLEPGDPRGGTHEAFLLIHPDDRETVLSAIRRSLVEAKPLDVEYRIVRPDGAERILHTLGEPTVDPLERRPRLIGTAQDITDRRLAQRHLLEQGAFLETILRQAADAVVVCDAEGRLVLANAAARRMAGVGENDDLEGGSAMDAAVWGRAEDPDGRVIPPADWSLAKALRGETTVGREARRVRSDGSRYDILISAAPVRDPDGRIIGAVATYSDISERKRAEHQLRESEDRYRSLVEASPDGIAVHDGRCFRYVNPAAVRLLGAGRPEDLIGKPLLDVVHPDSRALAAARARQVLEERRPTELVEEKLVRFDGQVIDVEIVGLPAIFGDRPAVEVVARDVTARRRAEEALRESQRTLSTLMSNLPGMAYRCRNDAEWTVEFVSEGCRTLTGYTPEDLTGGRSGLGRLIHPDDRERVWRAVQEAIGDGRAYQLVYRIRDASGQEKWVWEQGQQVACLGETAVLEGFITDVTERHRALEELARARDEALEASRLKSTFLANISHEVRTPLNVILGYGAIVREHLEDRGDDSQTHLLQGIERAGQRLLQTIHQVLEYSRIVTGAFVVEPRRFEVNAVLEPVIQQHRALAAEKGLSFTWESRAPRAWIRADAHCLAGAVGNLLDNAVKFTREGEITVGLHRDAGALRLTIGDTGVGIAEEYLPRLFEPFNQEKTGHTRPFEGAGIGLALARAYLDLVGAALSVDSRKGVGSTFTIRLASAEPGPDEERSALAATPPMRRTAPAPSERPLVLVVEDDPQTQAYMKEVLKSRFDVLVASSGRKARRHLAAHVGTVSAILMDLSLRGAEDGLRFTGWIREQPEWRRIPVIATTAHASREDRDRALAAGCDDYLAKPFRPQELLERIEKLLF